MSIVCFEPLPQISGMNSDDILPIDLDALAGWMDHQGIGRGPLHDAVLLTGGSQNILLQFRRGEHSLILRRPALNPRSEADKTILREARILGALADSGVPHPEIVGVGNDPGIIGAAFFLMKEVAGFNATVSIPDFVRNDPTIRHRMGLALIDGLAALATVDPSAVGLSDLGRLEGFLERQVRRWAAQLDSYTQYKGWTGRADLGDLDAVAAWLEAHCPQHSQPGLIHGDYHIGNVLYRDDGNLAAILDWEMATLGDPLMDLGRLLATWPTGDPAHPVMRVDPLSGYPTPDELVARYAQLTGRDLSDLLWFEIMGYYKLGLIFEGTYARAQDGRAEMTTGFRLHHAAKGLLERARQRIG